MVATKRIHKQVYYEKVFTVPSWSFESPLLNQLHPRKVTLSNGSFYYSFNNHFDLRFFGPPRGWTVYAKRDLKKGSFVLYTGKMLKRGEAEIEIAQKFSWQYLARLDRNNYINAVPSFDSASINAFDYSSNTTSAAIATTCKVGCKGLGVASLINEATLYANAAFVKIRVNEEARFCVLLIRDVNQGQEILTNYHWSSKDHNGLDYQPDQLALDDEEDRLLEDLAFGTAA